MMGLLLGALVLFVPSSAKASYDSYATDTTTLNATIARANALCALDAKYSEFCSIATSLTQLRTSIKGKTAAEQAAAIKATPAASQDNFDRAKYMYTLEVQAGKIEDKYGVAAGSGGSKSFKGDCNSGGVKLSIGINSSNECVGGNGQNPIYAYLQGIIKLMGVVIGLGLVLTLVVSGIQYSSSAGNPQQITKAKERIFNAVIGVLLYIMLAAILRYLIPNIFS